MRAGGARARRAAAVALLGAALGCAATRSAVAPAEGVPALVFVSRAIPRAAAVPGLGPYGRALAPGGRLMVRSESGAVRPLLRGAAPWDVADPAVSFDGATIAFAAKASRSAPWRIWLADHDGSDPRPLTPEAPADHDDFDPAWLPDGRIVFASTRWPLAAQAGIPATNLFTIHPDGTGLERLTSDRNGAEEPAVEPATGRILYARWWTNRWLASEQEALGVTLERSRAVASDTVNVWHALSLLPDGDGGRLAGGDPRTRDGVAAYQPQMLADGTLIGVIPEGAGFEPPSPRAAVRAFPGGFAAPVTLAGLGVNGASACAPAALADRRVVISLDREGRGDYGLWVVSADGSGLRPLHDRRGTMELDAAPLAPRPLPPLASPPREIPVPETPYRTYEAGDPAVPTFRFDCMNVFAGGPVDGPFPEPPPIQKDVRIRFYAALARPAAEGGDTVVLIREAPVYPTGGIHVEDLPGDTPMFEQLVDSKGRVLRSSMGPAHVPGMNFARAGAGTRCVGCHAGHSAHEVPMNYHSATWINVAPSAVVSASSAWPGTVPRAAVDRRTRGDPGAVGWVAAGGRGEKLTLRWETPIEVRSIVLYAWPSDPAAGTDLVVGSCEIRLLLGGREVERRVLEEPVTASGTRADVNRAVADRLELIPLRATGRVLGRAVTGLAEVEVLARIHQESPP